MLPVLFAFGPVVISTLGVCIFLGLFLGSFFIWKRMKFEHLEDRDIFDILFITFFGGILGSWLWYILNHFDQYGFSLPQWFSVVFSTNFSWVGFILGSLYSLRLITRQKKLEFFELVDLMTFGYLFIQIWVLLGQFLDGGYIGSVTTLPVGLPLVNDGQKYHAVQLYQISLLPFVFFFLLWLENQYRFFAWYKDNRGNSKPGLVWLSYFLLVVLLEFAAEFFLPGKNLYGFKVVHAMYGVLLFLGVAFIMSRTGKYFNSDWLQKLWNPAEEEKPIRPPANQFQNTLRKSRIEKK